MRSGRSGGRERSLRRAKPDPIPGPALFLSPSSSIPSPDRGTSIHSFARFERALACTTYRASLLISIYSWKENRLHSTFNRVSELVSNRLFFFLSPFFPALSRPGERFDGNSYCSLRRRVILAGAFSKVYLTTIVIRILCFFFFGI